MIAKYLLIIPFLLIVHLSYSQDWYWGPITPEKVQQEITENLKSNKPDIEKILVNDSLLYLLRIHYEYLSYKSKLEVARNTEDKELKIICLKRIRNFPFYTVHHHYYGVKLRDLYVHATNMLIREYRGNLEELYKITVVPSTAGRIYGLLGQTIEASGGVWDKEKYIYDPEISKRGSREFTHRKSWFNPHHMAAWIKQLLPWL